MNLSVSLSKLAAPAPATGMGEDQLAGLAQLTTKMRAIRRDTQMPEEMKKKQLAMLREQTQAIQQTVTDKLNNKKTAVLVDSTAESARAVEEAGAAKSGPEVVETNETGEVSATSPQPAANTAAGLPGDSAGSTQGNPTLGSIVDTYA